MELLVNNPDNPRSLNWVAQTLRSRLLRMEHLAGGATRPLAALLPKPGEPSARGTESPPEDTPLPQTLLTLLENHRRAARAVSDGLSGLFFTHSRAAAHSVSA